MRSLRASLSATAALETAVPFTIDDLDVERLARDLAAATGEPVPHAVAAALRERLARVHRDAEAAPDGAARDAERPRLDTLADIQAYLAALPDLDPRTPEEILGYAAAGLPH